ncbi:MAG: tRNA pseudouridine(55) synthase TruB, partial [Holdemanella sp.]|nr:tRNA pseudouridine(55) synthase TruB [Holdemanella sp.]
HTGTLDPMATGVLVVLCGKACKALQFIEDTDKTYVSSIQLGYSTTSDDIYGDIIDEKEINLDFDFDEVLSSFLGKQHQLVPMASAKKINGKKLLDYQRKNMEVKPVYTDIEIYSIESIHKEDLSFEVHCSSGTYVRSICRDFGLKTNNLACMKTLERTKVGRFTIDMAQSLEEVALNPVLYPMKMVLEHIPMIEYEDIQCIYQGKHIHFDCEYDLICFTENGEPVAIYKRHHNDVFSSVRGLW